MNENILKNAWNKAKDFVKKSVKDIKKNAKKIIKALKQNTGTSKSKKIIKPGTLVSFRYDAKHKQHVYDNNPLVLSLGPSKKTKGLFLGLNLHWIKNVNERVAFASFFTELLKKRNGKLEYSDIKPFLKKYEGSPVLRSYFYNRVSTKVYIMEIDQYKTASALPTEVWMGGK
jgi:hypothetical protein